jgi:hypothetical protein
MPAGALALYAGFGILPALSATSLGGASLCGIANPTVSSLSGYDASNIERAWPIVQIVVLAGGVGQALRYWNASTGQSEG